MKTEHYFALFGIMLTLVNVVMTYFNLQHNRKKDFQDKLFQLKLDAYNELNQACYESVKRLDINSTPFIQIYDFQNKDEWVKYCEENMGEEILKGFELRGLIYKYAMFLPSNIVGKYYDFSNQCISFVSSAYHFETEIICDNQEQLWDKYFDLWNSFREDLNIYSIDESLKQRISSKM